MAVRILCILACAYLGLALLVFVFQSRLLYMPGRTVRYTPRDTGLSYEEVILETEDQVQLCAWLVPAERPRAVVLLCHGNAGNISDRLDTIRLFHELGLTTFIFDYRGYGASRGSPSEKGTYLDAEAAWDYLVHTKEIPAGDIIVFGRSLGGAVAARLAEQRAPKALILESSFTSVPDLGARLYPFLPVRLLSRFSYNAEKHVRGITCPVLVVHSPQDEIVPFTLGQRLFDAANEPKTFLQIRGGHNEGFLVSGRVYTDGIDAFISGLQAQ